MNKDLIEKIIFICYKSKLKYEDNHQAVINMRSYLDYLDKIDNLRLNNILLSITYLSQDKNNLLVSSSIYKLVGCKFQTETMDYYKTKIAEDFLNRK